MSVPPLTETIIGQHASADSVKRGRDYYQQGAVQSLVLRGMVLTAEVEGSDPMPYVVRCTFDANGIISATCTCPYDWGGWCKHIVATCLACIHHPETIEERPPLDTLLSGLSREQLQSLLSKLAERQPSLVEAIEGQVALLTTPAVSEAPAPSAPPVQRIEVDPKAVRRQVRSILHGLDRMRASEAYWYVGGVVDEVRQMLEQVSALLQTDDARGALVMLKAITDEYISESQNLDDSDGEVGEFFNELGEAWAEALLSADLLFKERKSWIDQLEEWQKDLSDYGVDDAFDLAVTAVTQSWDYPPLQRVLQGIITDVGAWEGEPPPYADELAVVRLRVLERRGRWQEYLYLAEAEGQIEAYVTMLVRLGRTQEAIDYGRQYLLATQEAFALAKALYDKGEREEGLQMGEHALTLEGPKASLAEWLRDEAATMGQKERALAAAEIAFRENLNLANYLRVAEIAGEQWPERREALLEHARHIKSYVPDGQVDVFLHEGLIDDAIAAVEPSATHTLVERVVDAALESRPDWVIQACQRQAESIINPGKAEYYSAAANWLAKARTAYRAAGREEEWKAYLNDLLAQHRRKYKLVPMLEALRR